MGYKQLNLFEETVLREIAHEPLRVDLYGEYQTKARLKARFNADTAIAELIRSEYLEEINENLSNGSNWNGYRLTPLGRSLLARSSGNSINYSVTGNANIAHNSPGAEQSININELDDDLKHKIRELQEATKKKDKSAILKTLGYIGDKSEDLLVAIIAGQLKL
jgi:hypothetical protein